MKKIINQPKRYATSRTKKVVVPTKKNVVNHPHKPFLEQLDAQKRRAPAGVGQAITDILDLECAIQGEYSMTDKEVIRFRTILYMINKNHPRGLRFRTMREGDLLMVWRIR